MTSDKGLAPPSPTQTAAGRPITRLEARQIALEILQRAEAERAALAQAEGDEKGTGVFSARPRSRLLSPVLAGRAPATVNQLG